MNAEDSQGKGYKELRIGQHKFVESKIQTPDGPAFNLRTAKENPLRYSMTIESRGKAIAHLISSGVTLFDADLKVNVDDQELKRSFNSPSGPIPHDIGVSKGYFWQVDENSTPQQVNFGNYGGMFLEPNEHGVLSKRSGESIAGISGQVNILSGGKLLATSDSAFRVMPITGTVEVVTREESKVSRLIVNKEDNS